MELDGAEQQFVDEILRQIFDATLHVPESVVSLELASLPDYRRVQAAWMLGEEALEAIREATKVLGMRIYELVSTQNIPGIGDGSGLHYVMDKRVGSNIYLRRFQ